jgi:hypothetical protein
MADLENGAMANGGNGADAEHDASEFFQEDDSKADDGQPLIRIDLGANHGKNRYNDLIDGVVMQVEGRDRIYDSKDRNGTITGQSKCLINGFLILRGGFVGVPFAVYARKDNGRKPVLDFSLVGNRQKQGLTPLTPESLAEWKAWKDAATAVCKDWYKRTGGAALATSKTAAVTADDLNIDFGTDAK